MSRPRRVLHHTYRLLIKWARTLHIYLTLFGLGLLLFFAVTGFMLNHEDWFKPEHVTRGSIPPELLKEIESDSVLPEKLRDKLQDRDLWNVPGEVESFSFVKEENSYRVYFRTGEGTAMATIERATGDTVVIYEKSESDQSLRGENDAVHVIEGQVPMNLLEPWEDAKKLPIVELLRKEFAVRGELSSFDNAKEENSLKVIFKAPGYRAEVTITTSDGKTKVLHKTRGIAGVLLDLHRGKDSGSNWSLVIDGVAILFVVVSITGVILWTSLRARARHGYLVIFLGLALSVWVYFQYVPR